MSFVSWLLMWVLLAASGKGTAGASGASSAAKTAAPLPPRSSAGGTGSGNGSGAPTGNGSAASTRNDPARTSTEPAVDPAAPPTYARDIASLFELRCVKCHGSPFARNDLRLTSYANVMRGGETGTAVIPGDPEGSLLLKKIEGRDKPSMPPRKPLSKGEKELLRRWISAGAPP